MVKLSSLRVWKSKNKNRSRLEIVRDILEVAAERIKKTRIMYQANLSYRLMEKYLSDLLESDLLRCDADAYYMITRKGKKFLQMFYTYTENAERMKREIKAIRENKLMLEGFCSNGDPWLDAEGHSRAEMPRYNSLAQKRWGGVSHLKGVVLAAGEGSRMKDVTFGAFPKELLPIGNVPTIRFPIEAMRLAGINDVLVVIAPRTKHGLVDGLQGGKKLGVSISYVVQEKTEGSQTGVAVAINSIREQIGHGEEFLVACGDSILCDFSAHNPVDCVSPLLAVHRSVDPLATILVYPTKSDCTRFGVAKFRHLVEKDGVLYGELEGIVEKPSLEVIEEYKIDGYNYVATGYYVFKPEIFPFIEKTKPGVNNEVQIADAMALALNSGEKIFAVAHARRDESELIPCEYWDVGIPEDYKEANMRLLDRDWKQPIGLGG